MPTTTKALPTWAEAEAMVRRVGQTAADAQWCDAGRYDRLAKIASQAEENALTRALDMLRQLYEAAGVEVQPAGDSGHPSPRPSSPEGV